MFAELNAQDSVDSLDESTVYFSRTNGTLPQPRTKYRLVDLFSGAGGMTLGFTEQFGHSFEPVWANDFNEPSFKDLQR